MEYPLMIPPFTISSFNTLTKKQVEQFFQWFLIEKTNRVQVLSQYIDQTGEHVELDYTPNSLIPLWDWFESQIEIETRTEEKIEAQIRSLPPKWQNVVKPATTQLSQKTLAIGLDISTYFGEVLVTNNDTIRWGYRTSPKKLDGVNRPLLIMGHWHDISIYQCTTIHVLTLKSSRERDSNRLYNMYIQYSKQEKVE